MRPKPSLRRKAEGLLLPAFLLLLLYPGALSASPESRVLLESAGPLSSSVLHEADSQKLLLGGLFAKTDEDQYLRLLNTGASPESIPGPERLYRAEIGAGGVLSQVKTALAFPGFHLGEPSAVQPLNSSAIYLVYSRGTNAAAESCRKKGESLRSCQAFLDTKELALAESRDGGFNWEQKSVLVKRDNSGDESAPASSSAIYTKGELVVYYSTTKQTFMKENLFRLRATLEGKRLAEPEAIRIEGFSAGTSLENPQVVRLRCPQGDKTAFTMVVNSRAGNRLPLFWSEDGRNFRKVMDTLVSSESMLSSPTQMPGPASALECQSAQLSGVKSQRDMIWAEKGGALGWLLKRQKVEFWFP